MMDKRIGYVMGVMLVVLAGALAQGACGESDPPTPTPTPNPTPRPTPTYAEALASKSMCVPLSVVWPEHNFASMPGATTCGVRGGTEYLKALRENRPRNCISRNSSATIRRYDESTGQYRLETVERISQSDMARYIGSAGCDEDVDFFSRQRQFESDVCTSLQSGSLLAVIATYIKYEEDDYDERLIRLIESVEDMTAEEVFDWCAVRNTYRNTR